MIFFHRYSGSAVFLFCLTALGCQPTMMDRIEMIDRDDFQAFEKSLSPEVVNTPIYPAGISVEIYLIHHACFKGRPQFVELLLERGADPMLLNSTGEICLFDLLGGSGDPEEMISILEMLYQHDPALFTFAHANSGDRALDYSRLYRNDEKVVQYIIDLEERSKEETEPGSGGV